MPRSPRSHALDLLLWDNDGQVVDHGVAGRHNRQVYRLVRAVSGYKDPVASMYPGGEYARLRRQHQALLRTRWANPALHP